MFWFCAINNEISTRFLSKKLRGIINSDMLQGNSNMHSLFSCFMFYLTWLLGCYCKIIHIGIGIAGCCGCDAVSLCELHFSFRTWQFCQAWCDPSLPHQHIFIRWIDWMDEWVNGRPLHARRESRGAGGLVIPGTARRQHGCPQPRTGT